MGDIREVYRKLDKLVRPQSEEHIKIWEGLSVTAGGVISRLEIQKGTQYKWDTGRAPGAVPDMADWWMQCLSLPIRVSYDLIFFSWRQVS